VKISVVTPVLNEERYIRRTVESVLGQRGDFELEYIVCDGGSTDRPLEILAEYAGRIRLIHDQEKGPQKAINKGMQTATGDIMGWLGADDLYLPGALDTVAGVFAKNPGLQWLYGRGDYIDEDGKVIRRPITWYRNLLGCFYSRHVLLCENYIAQAATFWRPELWRKAGPLNEKYVAAWDYDLWLRLGKEARALSVRKLMIQARRHKEPISENFYVTQFAEEYEICPRHVVRVYRLVHKCNQRKIVLAYKLLHALSK